MKFQVCEPYEFWWPVTVAMPDPETSGAVIEQGFEARFLLLGREALKDRESGDPDALLREVVKDWRGVDDGEGGETAFSQAVFDQCLAYSHFQAGLYRAYLTALNGQEARVKN